MKKSALPTAQSSSYSSRARPACSFPELCRERGISSAMFYKLRSKFGNIASMQRIALVA